MLLAPAQGRLPRGRQAALAACCSPPKLPPRIAAAADVAEALGRLLALPGQWALFAASLLGCTACHVTVIGLWPARVAPDPALRGLHPWAWGGRFHLRQSRPGAQPASLPIEAPPSCLCPQIRRKVLQGERPQVPPQDQLPGFKVGLPGLDVYCQLMRYAAPPHPPHPPPARSPPSPSAHGMHPPARPTAILHTSPAPARALAWPHHSPLPRPPMPSVYATGPPPALVDHAHFACPIPRRDCWAQEPGQRPLFTEVVQRLSWLLRAAR